MIRSIFALLGLFISTSSFAQMRFLVPNDQDYFVNDEGSYRYIYTASERALLPELIKYNQLFKNIYEKEYNWVFDEQATLVLASTHNQIANGFATPLPRLLTVYYSGGAEIIDEFSVGSWLYTLLSHETSHLYQLNIKRGYAQTLKNTFGPSDLTGAAILPPFTYTELSNAFLPAFLLEGNSTFNESRFGNGGRLYSGASRALLLQMTKAGDITTARLMNEHIEFPFGREKYLIGGFFFLDLARNHGTDAANRYFYNHADYKFNPFNVNDPFIETFGISYNLALKRFLDYWRPMSESQQSAKERPLFTSLAHPGLTKDQNEIRTLTTDGRKLPVARIFNLKTKRWTEKTVNMPMGKLFRDNKNNLVAASSEPINNREKRAGLYGENYRFSKKYLDKYVYDQKAGQMLWANAKSSFVSPDLYTNTKNKQHIGQSSSSGIIGDDQNAYYFKQFAKKRTMMRGQEPLFSFNGFYGVPVEASGARVYFIGPAAWGSSLYYYENKNFFRAHKSDT
ncbi:MAG: hypothetical protein KDD38_08470, partial [Bdellovibrionales bacterium]|nr:hypothetical protein [Bdellovibrionales bacterium]